MWPRFSPRSIVTCALPVTGQSQTSALLRAGGRRNIHRHLAGHHRQRHRHCQRRCALARRRDCLLDRRLVAAQHRCDAIDHDLRGVDLAVAACVGISALTIGVAVQRQRVLPAQIIPIVDGQAQRDQRRIARQLAEQLVGGRTGRAALAGEQFDDRPRLGRVGGRWRQGGGADDYTHKGDVAKVHADPTISPARLGLI